jgi:quinol monooxygenase YgiN
MPFMLKIQWDIKAGREADFRASQAALCEVMLEHPGVICYHVDYPSQRVSQWTEIYATDEAFAAHLANETGKGPLGTVVEACEKITCRCWGNPSAASKKTLAGFGATYYDTAPGAFVLNPMVHRDSRT